MNQPFTPPLFHQAPSRDTVEFKLDSEAARLACVIRAAITTRQLKDCIRR